MSIRTRLQRHAAVLALAAGALLLLQAAAQAAPAVVEIVDYHRGTTMTIGRKAIAGIDFSAVSTGRRLKPVHPGEVLLKDFIEPMELTRYKVAKNTGVPQRRIDEICAGNRAMSADTALPKAA